MHFVFYPNHEYGCPHVGHCPHLGGAALGALVFAADEQTEWMDALLRQVDALRAEDTIKYHKIEELTARVEQLERELKAERQKQFQRKKQEPTAQDTPDATPPPGPKKRGAPVGHPGWYRKRPREFDRLVVVPAPCECMHGHDAPGKRASCLARGPRRAFLLASSADSSINRLSIAIFSEPTSWS
jgi:hypothetical protein